MWKNWILLKNELATLGEELLSVEWLPANHKEQSPDPTKRHARREDFEQLIDVAFITS